MKKLFFSITLAILIMAISQTSQAKVTGLCVNCHTMHSSQGGAGMIIGYNPGSGPYGTLLRANGCLGCHGATLGSTSQGVGGAPIVYNVNEPSFNAAKGLAGGNFHWVKTDDTKGHNVFSDNVEDTLSPVTAPGKQGGQGCGTPDSCHDNIHGTNNAAFGSRQGCTKCHMVTTGDGAYGAMSGYHHADDSDTVVGSAMGDTDGFYRFLVGKLATAGRGVAGIEDDDWELETTVDHNQYQGAESSGGLTTHTMTAFCSGCHGLFHTNQGSANPWLRHPSDAVLPDRTPDSEYEAYTTYNPLVPVARTAATLSGYTKETDTVTPGSDMVMCLSCHRAHGSPNYKMLRWDYKDWPGAGTNGCAVCHTSKS